LAKREDNGGAYRGKLPRSKAGSKRIQKRNTTVKCGGKKGDLLAEGVWRGKEWRKKSTRRDAYWKTEKARLDLG